MSDAKGTNMVCALPLDTEKKGRRGVRFRRNTLEDAPRFPHSLYEVDIPSEIVQDHFLSNLIYDVTTLECETHPGHPIQDEYLRFILKRNHQEDLEIENGLKPNNCQHIREGAHSVQTKSMPERTGELFSMIQESRDFNGPDALPEQIYTMFRPISLPMIKIAIGLGDQRDYDMSGRLWSNVLHY